MMKTYSKDYLQEIAFPLSGIGCGGLSISGIGALVDWELTGKANKRSVNEYSHFAVKAERDGRVLDARVLQCFWWNRRLRHCFLRQPSI